MSHQTIRLFVGYDPREAVAFHTFAQSVLEKSSLPVSITPLVLQALPGYQETQHLHLLALPDAVPVRLRRLGRVRRRRHDLPCRPGRAVGAA
jgi:hypothetical protein